MTKKRNEMKQPELTTGKTAGKTCRTCRHRERWQCGSKVIQYCGIRRSARTSTGLKRIRVTDPACECHEEDMP